MTELPVAAGLAYRESFPEERSVPAPVALLLHGYPSSSYLWRSVAPALAAEGWRAIAPDLSGFGDSPPDPPGTWERHVEALERFRAELELERFALVMHDWGGLIGLRWACAHREAVTAMVLSGTGFFPDGHWHGLARAVRTPGQGEELYASVTPDTFTAVMRASAPEMPSEAIGEYWKAFEHGDGRADHLALYRSGDMEKIESLATCPAELEVPTLVLWGSHDEFAPVSSAHRFHREIPGSELVVLEDTGHFPMEQEPQRYAAEVARFLGVLDGA